MNTQDLWQLFLETGSPEMYLLYSNAKKMEGQHVLDCQGFDSESHKL